jgi:nitrilase
MVIGTATALQGSDIPDTFPQRDRLFTLEEWINPGDAVVVNARYVGTSLGHSQ